MQMCRNNTYQGYWCCQDHLELLRARWKPTSVSLRPIPLTPYSYLWSSDSFLQLSKWPQTSLWTFPFWCFHGMIQISAHQTPIPHPWYPLPNPRSMFNSQLKLSSFSVFCSSLFFAPLHFRLPWLFYHSLQYRSSMMYVHFKYHLRPFFILSVSCLTFWPWFLSPSPWLSLWNTKELCLTIVQKSEMDMPEGWIITIACSDIDAKYSMQLSILIQLIQTPASAREALKHIIVFLGWQRTPRLPLVARLMSEEKDTGGSQHLISRCLLLNSEGFNKGW